LLLRRKGGLLLEGQIINKEERVGIMKNELITIENVRGYGDENGTIYLNLEDVSRGLGFVDNSKGVEYIRWNTVSGYLKDFGFSQEVAKDQFIPENIFYRLAMKAKNEIAEKFQIKVADEILPSIRKHGAYMTEITIDKILNDPDFGIQLLTTLKEERRRRMEAERTNHILMHVNKTYTSTEIGKELGFKSASAFNQSLGAKKIQFKQNEPWVLYSQYADRGYVEIKQEVLDNGRVIYHRRWTQFGREFLLKLYSNHSA
jgi:prophage antirepressor-like protein